MNFGFDKSKWPLVVITVEGAPDSEENMSNFLKEWAQLYHESMVTNKRYRLLFDSRKAEKVEVKYLMMMAKFLLKMKTFTEQWMEKTGILVCSPTIKLLIQIVFKFYKAVRPFKVFNKADEALEWVLNDEDGDEKNLDSLDIKDFPTFNSKIDFSDT